MLRRISLFACLLVSLSFGYAAPHSYAHEEKRAIIGLRTVPSAAQKTNDLYFSFASAPDQHFAGEIFISNVGTAAGKVDLYPVDAVTGTTSGTVYQNRDVARQDVGKWLTLALNTMTLIPGESKVVPFTVKVPHTVRPGQHVGGIVAELQNTGAPPANKRRPGDFLLLTKHLTILAVQIDLPGTRLESLRVTGVQIGTAHHAPALLLGLYNTGTTMLKPDIGLQIIDSKGSILQTQNLQLDTILPENTIQYPISLNPQVRSPGSYEVNTLIHYGQQTLHAQNRLTIASPLDQHNSPGTATPSPGSLLAWLLSFPLWLIFSGVFLALGLTFGCGYRLARKGGGRPAHK